MKTELYLKPGAIVKERQICQAFQLNSAHDLFIRCMQHVAWIVEDQITHAASAAILVSWWFRSQATTRKSKAPRKVRKDEKGDNADTRQVLPKPYSTLCNKP